MTVGERVRELREKKGWSQGQLLKQARQFLPAGEAFARATLSRIENGHRKANSGVLQALARSLDTSPEYLMGLEGQEGLAVVSAEDIEMPQPELAAIVARILPLKAGQRHQVCVVISDLLTALGVPPAAAEDESAADQALREVARSRATRSAVLQQEPPTLAE
jgi:transcriptional regulator with XRE-family HTH domain